ncbi:hypothetical protein RRG08_035647 [Elysia crispata]|uniref:Uncharacterized protein n=1 Tax=Elysia crispata TaxID=231223 RepID=A0AAE0YBI5_9GAST|nr:hypothetical protein RRG08_035647 [Elysia crispata]
MRVKVCGYTPIDLAGGNRSHFPLTACRPAWLISSKLPSLRAIGHETWPIDRPEMSEPSPQDAALTHQEL